MVWPPLSAIVAGVVAGFSAAILAGGEGWLTAVLSFAVCITTLNLIWQIQERRKR